MEGKEPDVGRWTKVRRFLSHESGPFAQFVKYGVIGVMSTVVQMVGFYVLAATCLKCLGSDDWAVRLVGLPSVEITDGRGASGGMSSSGSSSAWPRWPRWSRLGCRAC